MSQYMPASHQIARERQARLQRMAAHAVHDDGIDLRRKAKPPAAVPTSPVEQQQQEMAVPPPRRLTMREAIADWYMRHPPQEIEPEPHREPEPSIPSPVVHTVPTVSLNVREIICLVCDFYGASYLDMISQRRTQDITRLRHIAVYLSKTFTTFSFPHIGRQLGGRDHTTALHSYHKICKLLMVDTELQDEIAALRDMMTWRMA